MVTTVSANWVATRRGKLSRTAAAAHGGWTVVRMRIRREVVSLTALCGVVVATCLHGAPAQAAWQHEVTGVVSTITGTVAVVDSGVDAQRTAGRVNIVGGVSPVGGPPNRDDIGHGSQVALVAAESPTGQPSRINIMPVRVYATSDRTTAQGTAGGIDAAVKMGAKVINVSLGGPDINESLQRSVRDAVNSGRIVVAASGNEGSSALKYPAAIPGVVAVGAVGPDMRLWSRSNTGAHIMLVAPGDGIRILGVTLSGTSFAAPQVSSIAAGLAAAYPSATNTKIIDALTRSAVDLGTPGRDSQYGFGLVDYAGASLILGGANPAKLKLVFSSSREGNNTVLSAKLTDAKGSPVTGQTVTFSTYVPTGSIHGVLGTAVTGLDGRANLNVLLTGRHTVFARTTANAKFVAAAGTPSEVSGATVAPVADLQANDQGLLFSARTATGTPIVGYSTPLWASHGNSWYSLGSVMTGSDGIARVSGSLGAPSYSFGNEPEKEAPYRGRLGTVDVKAAVSGNGSGSSFSIVASYASRPLIGLYMEASVGSKLTTMVTGLSGENAINGAGGVVTYTEPGSGTTLQLTYRPVFAEKTAANNWKIEVEYPKQATGSATLRAVVTNRGSGVTGRTVALQRKQGTGWVLVRNLVTLSNGSVSLKIIPPLGSSTWRFVASTPDGELPTTPFSVTRVR